MSDEHGHHPRPKSASEQRVEAIEALLVERGLITSDVVDAIVETYEHDVGPMNGARVVARAWVDAGVPRPAARRRHPRRR